MPWDRRRCGLSDEIPCCVPDLSGRRETESEVPDRHVPENDAASLRPPNEMSRLGSLDREGRAALGGDEVEGLLGGADRVLNGRLIVGRPLRPGDNEVLAVGTRGRQPAACDRPRDVGRQLAIEAKDTAGGCQRAREQAHHAMIRPVSISARPVGKGGELDNAELRKTEQGWPPTECLTDRPVESVAMR